MLQLDAACDFLGREEKTPRPELYDNGVFDVDIDQMIKGENMIIDVELVKIVYFRSHTVEQKVS